MKDVVFCKDEDAPVKAAGVGLAGRGAVVGFGVGIKETLVVVVGERIGPGVVEIGDVLEDEHVGFFAMQEVGDDVDVFAEVADVPVTDEHARESELGGRAGAIVSKKSDACLSVRQKASLPGAGVRRGGGDSPCDCWDERCARSMFCIGRQKIRTSGPGGRKGWFMAGNRG